MPIASGEEGFAPIRIHQDMKVLVSAIGADEMLYYDLDPARQAYLIQIEGEGMVNGNELAEGDAAEITATREVTIRAKTPSHYILFDMAADEA